MQGSSRQTGSMIQQVARVDGCRRIALLVGVLVTACALPSAASALPAQERVRIIDPPRAIGDFELTDQQGRPFRFETLTGRPVLVVFGFTSCPDICPTILGNLNMLAADYADELEDTAIVFVSVDGARDTPERLNAFLGHYSGEFIGLVGDTNAVQRVASKFRAVFYPERPDPSSGHYNVAHSVQVFAVDRQGRLRAEYHNASLAAMATVTAALAAESP